LEFETDGAVVTTRFTPRAEHSGFRETVHGGVLSTLLDEIMVWACAVKTKKFSYCAELTVRFNKPARPGVEITATAEMTANRRDRIFEARGELRGPDGTVLTTATGKFMPVAAAFLAQMEDDFVGDPGPYLAAAGVAKALPSDGRAV
jgi:uncharacterized protein (TIGR00369 family)